MGQHGKVVKIQKDQRPQEFDLWLMQLLNKYDSYEIIVEKGFILRVQIYKPGIDWEHIFHGRIIGNREVVQTQIYFYPAIVDGKFVENIGNDN